MVHKLLVNGSQTKCAYVWTRLQTCAAPSVYGSHTIRCEQKFVIFCAQTQKELDALGVLSMHLVFLLASGLQKIN